ncbi:serine/threonine protein kinase [Pseudoalteromonas sp. NBT06-2]|uniref:serine/threonine-protein kinase n=1 Tax=Pseudoalteromonas sp. NBT06-2 TaxID=2025950 RepID=UPI000BA53994|nr:serine/threonine-protein kinase [Pseudoalteromonas sp. NBT06-2]PAJ74526.1 serine/threonine protein kinase [Pseudoalteromonas sp. NBT06-2]
MDNKLPQYTREKLLGEGGMGKVYLAKDNHLQRHVAIKELTYQTSSQAKSEIVNNALQEARLLARINHSNIIQIYNIHDEKNQISLVMEYFKSKTLTQFQNETHCTLIQKLALLSQLSAGLAAAHKNGVIHCDLKPSNILINNQGELKITDFGIACLASNENHNKVIKKLEDESTKHDELKHYGCLLFMSPEQIKQQKVDYRSDIFSLGIIAYQLIVGSHPFANNGIDCEAADRICEYTPEHAKNLMLNAPTVLTDLLMEMLVKPIEQRTLTATVIENRLKHIKKALIQMELSEQVTVLLPNKELPNNVSAQAQIKRESKGFYRILSLFFLCFLVTFFIFFYSQQVPQTKQVVILKPTLADSPSMAAMQQDLVISAIEDALRQSVINTKNMYLVSQREVNAIGKAYPDNMKKLKRAVGASDIISTTLECDNNRCKVSFSRLVSNPNNSETLSVKSEKNWVVPIEKFNAIYSTSQSQFASLFPEHSAVNQAGLVQRPINEDDYRDYIALFNEIRGEGNYSTESLSKLEDLLTRSPYLYAAYGLYRETASKLFKDSHDTFYLNQFELILQRSPPAYRYSVYEAIERFWLVSYKGKMELAKQQIIEAENRGANDLILLELKAYMFFVLGDYKNAVESYSGAFILRPSTTLLNNIAFSYWRMGDLLKAESALNQMLKIVPTNIQAKRLQANIWQLQGKLTLAISAYEEIVTKLNSGKDLTNLSLAYALNKQYEKSLELARKALERNPKHPFKLLNLADSEKISGNNNLANAYYQKVISILENENEVKYLLGLAQAYAQLNKEGLAIDTLKKAQELVPKNGEVSYTSALIYSLLKEKSSAIYHVKTALNNNVGVAWFNLPWFDSLCTSHQFKQLMEKFENTSRCVN